MIADTPPRPVHACSSVATLAAVSTLSPALWNVWPGPAPGWSHQHPPAVSTAVIPTAATARLTLLAPMPTPDVPTSQRPR